MMTVIIPSESEPEPESEKRKTKLSKKRKKTDGKITTHKQAHAHVDARHHVMKTEVDVFDIILIL